MGYVLAVAVITWGGVFVYMLRLEKLTRSVEADVRRLEENASAAVDASESIPTPR
jgi:hypothetical protein